MTKKVLAITILFLGLLLVRGAVSNPVFAATRAVVGVELDNTAGTIPITVYVTYYHLGSGAPGPQFDYKVTSPAVAAGAKMTLYSRIDDTDAPEYWVSWRTDCSDPPAKAIYQGTWGNDFDPGGGIAAYKLKGQDVHCTTPNATPYITNTACANVGWSLTGVGVDGANIKEFWVYRSTGDLSGDPSISFRTNVVGPSSRSVDWGSLGAGTYNVRIRAVSWQDVGSWSSVGSFNCGSLSTAASGLSASPSCNGTSTNLADKIVAVNFSWSAASAGSTEQWLDYSVWNNNFAGGTFNSQSVSTGATGFNFSTGFPQGVRFYWRVNNKIGGNWYPSVTANFLTPTCPPNAIWPSAPPLPTPHVGQDCAAEGCTSPTYTYSISRPRSWWHMWSDGPSCGPRDVAGYTTGTSSGAQLFCVGDTVYWEVKPADADGTTYNAMRAWNLGSGGTITSSGGVTITWSWEYTVRIYLTGYNYGDSGAKSASKHVTANSESTFCNDSSSATCVGTPFTGLNGSASYQRTFCAPDCDFGAYAKTIGFTSDPCNCPTPGPTPTPEPVVITLTGFSECTDGLNPKVHLAWTSNSGSTGYTVFRDGLDVTNLGVPSSLVGSSRSWDITLTGADSGVPHSWKVRGTGGTFDPKESIPISVTTASCTPPPADPSNLIATTACDASGNPTITFTWQDNSNIEQGFWMDVSHDAFTGPSSTTATPSVWGVKGITRSGAETTATGGTVPFLWNNAATTNTAGQLDSGDANSSTAATLAPERNVTYYWRVKAYSADRQSNHIYPGGTDGADPDTILDGSKIPPGISFTTPNCQFDLQVSNNPAGNTQVYEPGATATFSIQVTNTSAATIAYPGGAGVLGAWTTSNAPALGCTGTSVTPVASADHTIQSIQISSTPIAVGASTIITLTGFAAPTAPGSYIANFYVLPNCSPNNDLNWTNNGFQLTYVVAAKTWFRTIGGDVGARGRIQQSNTAAPFPQSTAVLAGNPLDTSVSGKWQLNNYNKALFPSDNGGVYNYFNSRFRSRATDSLCTANLINLASRTGDKYIFCTGDMDAGGDVSAIAGNNNWVVFVDGNLTVAANFILNNNSTAVFIVRGNVTVNTNVTQADGVYIAGGTFKDYDDTVGKSRGTSPYQLTVKGAVYAHTFDLAAFLSDQPACVAASPSCSNLTTPTDYIVYQAKYLVQLSQMIGSPAVSWQEVAP